MRSCIGSAALVLLRQSLHVHHMFLPIYLHSSNIRKQGGESKSSVNVVAAVSVYLSICVSPSDEPATCTGCLPVSLSPAQCMLG